MAAPSDIDQIVQDILADMPLKQKSAIANLNEDEVSRLTNAFDIFLRGRLGKDGGMSRNVMQRMWKVLQKTHRLRCVK